MIEVACACDDRYAPHCATMLHSLLTRNEGSTLRIHLLHDTELSKISREGLRQTVENAGAEFNALPVPPALAGGFPDRKFHIACWYRVLLPTLLPHAPRILYLDADMIVLSAIRPLWDTDLQGKLFAAVTNPLYPFMPDRPCVELGLPGARDYLNSGVLVMDLDRMREEGLAQRLLDYARAHPDNPWPEQDALSVVCQGRWLSLHPRWNVQTTLFDLSERQLPFAPQEVKSAITQPAIVHFIGPHKPWLYVCRHPLRHLYAQHRRQTPWPEFELEGRTWKNRLLRPLSLGAQVRVKQLARRWRAICRVESGKKAAQ